MIEDNQTAVEQPTATEVETTTKENPVETETAVEIDYKKKFSESTRENQRILDEIKAKEEEIARLKAEKTESGSNYSTTNVDYPGFETLSEVEQEQLRAYTASIKRGVKEELYADPAIAHSRKIYAENKWNEAFEEISAEIPGLKEEKEEFRKKYFNPSNVPENIKDIMRDLSKVHLFDKAREIGAQETLEKASRYEIERANGGDKTPPATRSLADWHKLAQDNPAEFAKLAKQYKEDLASGKLG